MESKESSGRKSINQGEIPSEQPLFEIRDRVHLDAAILAFLVGAFISLIDTTSFVNFIIGCYWIYQGIWGFFTYRHRRICFYPSSIVLFSREKPLRIVKLSEINERYLFPYGLHHEDYRPVASTGRLKIIVALIAIVCFLFLPILTFLFMLAYLFLPSLLWILLGRQSSLRSDTLLLLAPEKESFIAISLQRLQEEEKMKMEEYLQSYLKLDPETLEKRWVFLPNNKG